jgi:hypothetical protein
MIKDFLIATIDKDSGRVPQPNAKESGFHTFRARPSRPKLQLAL